MLKYMHIAGFVQEDDNKITGSFTGVAPSKLLTPSPEQVSVLNAIAEANYDKYIKHGNAFIMLQLEETKGKIFIFLIDDAKEVIKLANCKSMGDILDLEVTEECYQGEIPGWLELVEATKVVYSFPKEMRVKNNN